MNITKEQCRAARALLNINQSELAEAIDVGRLTIVRYESDDNDSSPNLSTLNKIETYFDNRGIIFSENNGVAHIPSRLTYELFGQDGFRAFMDDVYKEAANGCTNFRIQNATPSNWHKYLGVEWYEKHATRMKKFADKISFKITCCEGNYNHIANSFAEYRWVKKDFFNDQSIYIYGDSVGFLSFKENNVKIIVIKSKEITQTLIDTFDFFWEHNTIIPK